MVTSHYVCVQEGAASVSAEMNRFNHALYCIGAITMPLDQRRDMMTSQAEPPLPRGAIVRTMTQETTASNTPSLLHHCCVA